MSDVVPLVPLGGAAHAVFVPVARVGDLPVGAVLGVVLPTGEKVCLAHTRTLGIRAVTDRCPHRDFPLSAGELDDDDRIECAWHGARFDCTTGDEITGPGCGAVALWSVRIDDDVISVAPPVSSP
jgi:nitrite reductase/ring-hydroxylating ferredoxin subunit